tara:strand:+ start:1692 stop:2279 length:588 start_codon:yes stop_codon:yes gene_type:complete
LRFIKNNLFQMRVIILIYFLNMLVSEQFYKEPSFDILKKSKNIEVRIYKENIIAKTSVPLSDERIDNSMFRTLASYIFGENEKGQRIPMTAPVTTIKNEETYDMIFYMLNVENIEELPNPTNPNIEFEKLNLGKCASISFSWLTNDFRVKYYKKQLKKYIEDNGYTPISPFMLNRYDSPWTLPWNRRNEILVKIK